MSFFYTMYIYVIKKNRFKSLKKITKKIFIQNFSRYDVFRKYKILKNCFSEIAKTKFTSQSYLYFEM